MRCLEFVTKPVIKSLRSLRTDKGLGLFMVMTTIVFTCISLGVLWSMFKSGSFNKEEQLSVLALDAQAIIETDAKLKVEEPEAVELESTSPLTPNERCEEINALTSDLSELRSYHYYQLKAWITGDDAACYIPAMKVMMEDNVITEDEYDELKIIQEKLDLIKERALFLKTWKELEE